HYRLTPCSSPYLCSLRPPQQSCPAHPCPLILLLRRRTRYTLGPLLTPRQRSAPPRRRCHPSRPRPEPPVHLSVCAPLGTHCTGYHPRHSRSSNPPSSLTQ